MGVFGFSFSFSFTIRHSLPQRDPTVNDKYEQHPKGEGRVMPDFEQAKEFLDKEHEHAKELKLERSLDRGLERGFGF